MSKDRTLFGMIRTWMSPRKPPPDLTPDLTHGHDAYAPSVPPLLDGYSAPRPEAGPTPVESAVDTGKPVPPIPS